VTENPRVGGSIPSLATNEIKALPNYPVRLFSCVLPISYLLSKTYSPAPMAVIMARGSHDAKKKCGGTDGLRLWEFMGVGGFFWNVLIWLDF